ncbi:NADP-dependent malic enzyme, mitochondrial [Tachyglossus aculeatus]|uniref:NADP-dependent malic enzyme, mitochondrial n=1 Tax=Tachyglossus aculeatus TaxID=9261 RepID=UPI0018F75EB1|nr:NADP-dependent malic enzyme, mitochondrial [Tachyglossus aculeatus]
MPPVDGTMAPVDRMMPPVDGTMPPHEKMPPVDGTMSPVVGTMPPVDRTMPPVDGTMPPVDRTMPPVDGTMSQVDRTMPSVNGTMLPTMPPVDRAMPPVDGPMPPWMMGRWPPCMGWGGALGGRADSPAVGGARGRGHPIGTAACRLRGPPAAPPPPKRPPPAPQHQIAGPAVEGGAGGPGLRARVAGSMRRRLLVLLAPAGRPLAHPAGARPGSAGASGPRRPPPTALRKRGYDITRNPHLNKGMAFTLSERLQLGIHGLLPPCFLSQDVQLLRVMRYYEKQPSDLDKYIILMTLQDRNEKLFYRVLTSDVEKFMPIVYTPTVGQACQQYGLTFRRPRGLFITIHDKGHIATMLNSWPEDNIKAVVVTDGERILGLGDLGSYGMGIPVGKLALYSACGGINPQHCLPVLLDVGTDNQELLQDPLYIGLRHRRVRGEPYDQLLDEFMQAVTDKYGINCLIQFEDFANANAFRLLNKYRNRYCMFNDDIQGTASVAVAGILAALRITQDSLSDHVFVFQGAGEAAMGIAHLLIMALEKEGVPRAQAVRKIWMVDSRGLIVKGRSHLNPEKELFAQDHAQVETLEEVVQAVKPTAIIGVAAIAGAFTEQILRDMASFNERPLIFALSNPTSKAECTADQCYRLTEGRGIFASGSPFPPVTLKDGRTFVPGQGNNAYVFPGVALGVISCGIRHISDEIFLLTAEHIAQEVSEHHLAEGRLYPPLNSIRDVSLRIAIKVMEYAYSTNVASLYPEPQDKEAFLRTLLYSPAYDSLDLDSYTWPTEAMETQHV